MTKTSGPVKEGYALLSNLALASDALEQAMSRPAMLPGIVCLYGPSGYGKSIAALYCANKHRGILVECSSTWTAKTLLATLTEEAGLRPARTLADMERQLIEELVASRRPLIIDEVDHIADGKTLQVIRDLHDKSGCAVQLVGEENLPFKLKKTERFHNRVLVWQRVEPASRHDFDALVKYYSPDVEIADDLAKAMMKQTGLVVRRLAINIHNVHKFAKSKGLKVVDLEVWGSRGFYDGQPPRRDV